MDRITKHQCPSCGGSLTIDNGKQMYCCLSCGSTYDYEYFREEKLHEMGEKYLSREEFMAAADVYKLILKKDSHEFLALKGLMLVAGNFKSVKEIAPEDKDGVSFSYDPELVREVLDGASEEDREYFKTFNEIYTFKKERSDNVSEAEALIRQKRQISEVISRNDKLRYQYYMTDRYGAQHAPKTVFIFLWAMDAIPAILALLIGVACGEEAIVATILLTGIALVIAAINLIVVFPRVNKIMDIDKIIRELYAKIAELEEQKKAFDHKVEKLEADIRMLIYELLKKDRVIMGDLKKAGK